MSSSDACRRPRQDSFSSTSLLSSPRSVLDDSDISDSDNDNEMTSRKRKYQSSDKTSDSSDRSNRSSAEPVIKKTASYG